MRTEYTIKITDNKGKAKFSVYPKRICDEKFPKLKDFYEARGSKVEYFKVQYNGAAFFKAEKIG